MQRTFIIGDIHGCFDELIKLTEQVALTDQDMLISLGDIVDRGNKSKEVYHYFLNRPNSKVLMGNHERKHLKGILSYAQEIVKLQFGEDYESFLQWLQTLDYFHETEEAIVVHAAFEHDKPLKEQKEEVLSGATAGERYLEKKYPAETYWPDHYTGEKPVVYGHHVVGDLPKIFHNTYGIDTGACHGGFLTAVELPGFKIHQVKVEKDYWKEEQKRWQIPVLRAKDWNNMELAGIRSQLEKLSYIEEKEVREFLSQLTNWVIQLEELISELFAKLNLFTQELINRYGERFNEEANKFSFKTFLFKSKANNLKLEDLQKSLNTPAKILQVAEALAINKP